MPKVTQPLGAAFKKTERTLTGLITEAERGGHTQLAKLLRTQLLKLQGIGQVFVVELTTAKLPNPLPGDLELEFYRLWAARFPRYGAPSSEDTKAIRRLFATVIYPAYPQADEALLQQAIHNFASSTVLWVAQNQEIKTFAKAFRRVVDGPLSESHQAAVSLPADGIREA